MSHHLASKGKEDEAKSKQSVGHSFFKYGGEPRIGRIRCESLTASVV
jgi:hypothetical protein